MMPTFKDLDYSPISIGLTIYVEKLMENCQKPKKHSMLAFFYDANTKDIFYILPFLLTRRDH